LNVRRRAESLIPDPRNSPALDSPLAVDHSPVVGGEKRDAIRVSVVIPIYNEAENIAACCGKLFDVLDRLPFASEVIAVNDGSTDASLRELQAQMELHPGLRVVNLRRNYGQTAAIMAGIDHAAGDIIVTIDADLQNDPEDIPNLLEQLDRGYDVVSGWRKDRQDALLTRILVSRIANGVISKISGVKLKDYGCTLKAYRREILQGVRLYGEMHRFIPIYAKWMGAKIMEIPVRHHPRKFGVSKYGLERIIKVILDLIVVKFLDRHFVKPIYVFGGFGVLSLALAAVSFVYTLYLKLVEGVSMIQTPMPLVTVMCFLVAIVSILMGLLAEMLVRTYFESQRRAAYVVRELYNFGKPS
jgi:glycosyltransferase involved in cell wall biosynthesis